MTALLVVAIAIGVWFTRQRFAPLRVVPVTSFRGRQVDPAISPDGNHVAFAWDGDHGGNLDIYVQLIVRFS